MKGGAWYELAYLDEPKKMQGQKKVWEHLTENKDDYNKLNAMIKELM